MVKLNVQKISEKEIVIALLSQRAELLLKIRDGQEKLYCLDYLTRTLNQAGIFDKK